MDEMINLNEQEKIIDETLLNEQAIIYQEADKVNEVENESNDELIVQEELEEIILGSEGSEFDVELIEKLECDDSQGFALEKSDSPIKTEAELIEYYNNIKCDRVIGVYVKVNSNGYITDVTNDMFTKNLDGFIKIDEGDGDRFVHAETSYFEESITNENGNYRYKLPNN